MHSSSHPPHKPEANPIELGPDLPVASYFAMEPWNADRIHAMALYCSDGRWGEAFDEFCQRHLRLPRYDRWSVPGGPGCIAGRDEDQTVISASHLQLDFLIKAHQLEQIVLITHFGCAWYAQRLQQQPNECLPAQYQDIQAAAATLWSWYPNLRIDAFLAMRRHERLSFHQLALEPSAPPPAAPRKVV